MTLADELLQPSDYMKKIPKTYANLNIDKWGENIGSITC